MYVLPIHIISAHLSATRCPPILYLDRMFVILFTNFCSSNTRRFHPAPSDSAIIKCSCPITRLGFIIKITQHRCVVHTSTCPCFLQRISRSEWYNMVAQVCTMALCTLRHSWYVHTSGAYCRATKSTSSTGHTQVTFFCPVCSRSSCTVPSSSESIDSV